MGTIQFAVESLDKLFEAVEVVSDKVTTAICDVQDAMLELHDRVETLEQWANDEGDDDEGDDDEGDDDEGDDDEGDDDVLDSEDYHRGYDDGYEEAKEVYRR